MTKNILIKLECSVDNASWNIFLRYSSSTERILFFILCLCCVQRSIIKRISTEKPITHYHMGAFSIRESGSGKPSSLYLYRNRTDVVCLWVYY